MSNEVFYLESGDFLEMEHALSAWDHKYRQIGRGAFRGRLLHCQVGKLGVFRNYWKRAIHYQGVAPDNTVALGITLAQSGTGHWLGQPAGIDDVIVQRCGAEAEYVSANGWDSVVFTIPEDEMADKIAEINPDAMEQLLNFHGSIRLPPPLAFEIRKACLEYFDIAAHSLGPIDATSPLAAMTDFLVSQITRALVWCLPETREKRKTVSYSLMVKRAEEYVAQNPGKPLFVKDLCQFMNVSERTLRHAFYQVVDLSPLPYLKARKLNRVYRLLRNSATDAILVKQVAIEHGFLHFSQFSQDYRRLFGELPSETLRQGGRNN